MDASSPETPSSPIQESPFFSNVKNLTPICSAEAVRCLPIPFPVFRSPRIDIQRPASFSQREEKEVEGADVGATSNVLLKPGLFCSAETEVQSCCPSGSVDDYLVDPIEVGDPTNSPQGINKPNSLGSAFNSQRETVSKADDVQEGEVFPPKSMDLVQNTEYKRIDEWFDEFLECTSGAVCDSVQSDKFLHSFPESQDGTKLTTQAVRLRRFIQSETRRAMNPDGVSFRSITGGNFSHVDDHQYKNQVAVKASSTPSQPLNNALQPFPSLDGATFEQQAACEGIISTSRSTELLYKSDQLSAKTNRKRAKSEIESKRCSCRRSRCLKLYCECFAAGLYCLESCTCENCFNSTGYEDVVIDHRQQIEARDPLAFTSKVVIKHAMNTPADMKDGTWSTPPSARHKRGCNCKKTRCLKRYCECYQAGVGCSDRCHCECCDNSFGKREEEMNLDSFDPENLPHLMQDASETASDSAEGRNRYQMLPTCEELADIGAAAASASQDKGSQSREICYPSSVSPYQRDHSPHDFTPKLHGTRNTADFVCDTLLSDILKDDDRPEMLKDICSPLTRVKASPLNPKQVHSPYTQPQELPRRTGSKINLPAVPTFPSLTPYGKLKDRINQVDSHHKDNTDRQ